MSTADLRARWEAVMMNNYGTPPLALASGEGAVVSDADGNTYLDLLGGIAVNVLGHRHPRSSKPSPGSCPPWVTRRICMPPNPVSRWPNKWSLT